MENMTMNLASQILQLIGYMVSLVTLILLWRKALRPSEFRYLWVWLAVAWTLNLLGNIAWIVHDFLTGTTLNAFSVVDVFYVARYMCIGVVLWSYPAPLSRRAWFPLGITVLITIAVVWAIYFHPAMVLRPGDWAFSLGLFFYPVLDVGSVTLAWLRLRLERQSMWDRYVLLLFCAVASYAIANTMNLTENIFPPITGGIIPNLFWILTDVFLLLMVLGPDLPKEGQLLVEG